MLVARLRIILIGVGVLCMLVVVIVASSRGSGSSSGPGYGAMRCSNWNGMDAFNRSEAAQWMVGHMHPWHPEKATELIPGVSKAATAACTAYPSDTLDDVAKFIRTADTNDFGAP